IIAEFNQITSKNLKQEFFSALDKHTSRFLEVFESKKGTAGKKLSEYLMQMKSADIDIDAPQVSIGILTVVPEDSLMSPQGLPLEVTDTAIILEGVIAMDGLVNVPHSI
ncbi:hypothetical protein cypCar_00049090, partial [Cyprinus carpio]